MPYETGFIDESLVARVTDMLRVMRMCVVEQLHQIAHFLLAHHTEPPVPL